MLHRFFRSEPAAAIVLFCAAALALFVANSPLADTYADVLHLHLLGISVHHWINDGLMAIFFLLVGLEIKQEIAGGTLATWRSRALPGIAAVGGMVAPALVFVMVAGRSGPYLRGWAIPAATDIAFAIGVLALLGPRVPFVLRTLLVGIAVIDDLGAILVIALFYTAELRLSWLACAAVTVALLVLLNRRHVYVLPVYLAVGVVLWLCLYRAGIHATLAGVALAFAIPERSVHDQHRTPMKTTEHAIDRWVTFGILPLFGFANAGIAFGGLERADVVGSLPLGIGLGMVVGKQIGVFGAIWIAVRTGVASMPLGIGWRQLHAVAVLCGIGFTMSLFIGGLAFSDTPHLMDAVKIGVMGGSIVSGVTGALLLRRMLPQPVQHRRQRTLPAS